MSWQTRGGPHSRNKFFSKWYVSRRQGWNQEASSLCLSPNSTSPSPSPPPPPDWLLVLGKELRFSSAGYLLIRRQRGTELVLSSVSRVSLRLQKDSIHRRQRVEVNAEFLHPLSWLPCMDTKATKGYQLAQR